MTSNLQEALSNNKNVRLNSGTYLISSALRLRRDQTLRLAPGVTLIQRTRQQSAFVAIGAENLRIEVNGAIIRGPGGWSRAWTGMQGQEGSQGIRLIGCSGCSISGPGTIEGWGSAAISIVGGQGIRVSGLTIRGTARAERMPSGLKEGAVVRVTEASAAGRRLDTEIRFTRLDISGSSFGAMSGILNNTCDSIVRIDASSAKALTGKNGVRGTGSTLVLGLPAGGQTTVSRRPSCR